MVIEVSPETDALIRARIESGRYADATAVVDEAIRLLDERERLATLREMVDEAEAEVARGEVAEWTPELFARLREEAAAALHAETTVSGDTAP